MRLIIVAAALVMGLGSTNAFAAVGAGAQFGGVSLSGVDPAAMAPVEQAGDEAASFSPGRAKPYAAAAFRTSPEDEEDFATGSLAAPDYGSEDRLAEPGKPSASRAPVDAADDDYTGSINRSSDIAGKPMAVRKPVGEEEDDDVLAYGEDRSGKPVDEDEAE